MIEQIQELGIYDHVEFTLESQGDIIYRGQFRGIIKDTDRVFFDKEGSAIWVTSDNGFEIMSPISDVTSIIVTEKYGS